MNPPRAHHLMTLAAVMVLSAGAALDVVAGRREPLGWPWWRAGDVTGRARSPTQRPRRSAAAPG